MAKQKLDAVTKNGRTHPGGGVFDGARVERVVALGSALSDPIRVKMLGMMAEGRACCDLPDLGAPAGDRDAGICVCEFQDAFGVGQSRVSYHMRKLKDAGLVREEKRGKWSFYSLDREIASRLLDETTAYLVPGGPELADGC